MFRLSAGKLWLTILVVACACLALMAYTYSGNQGMAGRLEDKQFKVSFDDTGLTSISLKNDLYKTDYVKANSHFTDLVIRYRKGDGKLTSFTQSVYSSTSKNGDGNFAAVTDSAGNIRVKQQYTLVNGQLNWNFSIENVSNAAINIEDLVVPIAYNNATGENSAEIFERKVVKHHFIAGNNSFLFWERPNGEGPYLLMVPQKNTGLEYFDVASRGRRGSVFQAYIHSFNTGNNETRGKWPVPHTKLVLAPATHKDFGFAYRWAKNREDIHEQLYQAGLLDIRVIPGMTLPSDLDGRFSIRTQKKINSIDPEFPSETEVVRNGTGPNNEQLYTIRFKRLGENKLVIKYGDGEQTRLDFFSTEPLETLYKKRAAFIVNKQQHRNPAKWYDGLFSQWDMKEGVLRGPDNTDGFDDWWGYVLACDDPALCKAPFVAAKNVHFPNQKEIDAVEYYIEHFVWGKLQRTNKELPNPYGIYGTPNWMVQRDSVLRSQQKREILKDKMHVWRSFDYAHILMMYYHMYQIAKYYPGMTHYLNKDEYLVRAKETAKGFFLYPYEDEQYKWGAYNELIIPDLIDELAVNGYKADADFLKKEWEKKAKYFIYDDKYPFRSEYAVDATAYESTHALAAYAIEHPMPTDKNLWFDQAKKVWYSHPEIKPTDAPSFMAREINANIACRGWIEPAYYQLGSDFRGSQDKYLLSYMSQMGGWSILDYGLHYTNDPAPYIQLGYASYLSSFALINSGTSKSNYGYWYPGENNDGATGWAFEPQKYATTWIRKSHGRGAWYYDGEIDLGFGGALRTAATVVADDPVFGKVAYGGSLQQNGKQWQVVPKDGLQQKLYARTKDIVLGIEIERDGFATGKLVTIDPVKTGADFIIENRDPSNKAHTGNVSLKQWPAGTYQVLLDGKKWQTVRFSGKDSQVLAVPLKGASAKIGIVKI